MWLKIETHKNMAVICFGFAFVPWGKLLIPFGNNVTERPAGRCLTNET